jgi:hypothetical protein
MNFIMQIFENGNYKLISNLVEEKMPILRQNKEFNQKYESLMSKIEELSSILQGEQKEKFDEIIKLFYETEEYYFSLSYSLGVKYGEDLSKI